MPPIGAYGFDDRCSVDQGTGNDGDGYTICGGDCNDSDVNIHPSALEVFDSKYNNCNGIIDEGYDCDSDGYPSCGGVDCNDGDASINPSAPESCMDGIDNNCDGFTDLDDPECAAANGAVFTPETWIMKAPSCRRGCGKL